MPKQIKSYRMSSTRIRKEQSPDRSQHARTEMKRREKEIRKETPFHYLPGQNRTEPVLCTPMMSQETRKRPGACRLRERKKGQKKRTVERRFVCKPSCTVAPNGPASLDERRPHHYRSVGAPFPPHRRSLHVSVVRLGVLVAPPRLNLFALPLVVAAKA